MFAVLLSPLGKVAIILAAFLAWTAYQRSDAASQARTECQEAQLRKTLAEVQRQRDAAWAALADAEKQATVTEKELADLEAERDRIEQDSKPAGALPCKFPAGVSKRLSNIR